MKEELGEDSEASSDEEITYRVITSIGNNKSLSDEKKFQTNFRIPLRREPTKLSEKKSNFNGTYISDLSGFENNPKNARISSIYSTSNFNTLLDENEINKRFNSVVKGSLPFDKSEPLKYVVSIPQTQRTPPKKIELFEMTGEQHRGLSTTIKEKLLSKNKVSLLKELKQKKNIINKLKKIQSTHSLNASGNYDADASQDINNLNYLNDYTHVNSEGYVGSDGVMFNGDSNFNAQNNYKSAENVHERSSKKNAFAGGSMNTLGAGTYGSTPGLNGHPGYASGMTSYMGGQGRYLNKQQFSVVYFLSKCLTQGVAYIF